MPEKQDKTKVSAAFYFFKAGLLLLLMVTVMVVKGQTGQLLVVGFVTDSVGSPVPFASVVVEGGPIGVSTDINGRFRITLPAAQSAVLTISCVGYKSTSVLINADVNSPIVELRVKLDVNELLIDEIRVSSDRRWTGNIERVNARDISFMPNVSGNFESIIKLMPGVASTNELSSQYSVRGGNFDENLVYVNDIEIYRPFLVRSGQQEGLSFINSDLVSAVEFSAGAFNAEFGDRMSSVLNVSYRMPTSYQSGVSLSLLGASAYTEGVLGNRKFSYITGVRYKTSSYLLNTLDVKGDYTPSFLDWQGLFSYRLNDKLAFSFLGNYATNSYQFAPDVRETRFGVFSNALQLKIYYEGKELDRYISGMGAAYVEYAPSQNTSIKIYSANYITHESETFDLLGEYFLNELDNSMGSGSYGDSLINVGIGGFLNHARNFLFARINNFGLVGSVRFSNAKLKWGAQLQHEFFDDELNEWNLLDSSGYAIPYNGSAIGLSNVMVAGNSTSVNKLSAFSQLDYSLSRGAFTLATNTGLRLLYWDYTGDVLVSPRVSLSLKNQRLKNFNFHLAGGVYYQPPFYRELRMPNGSLNPNIKAQRSVQLLAGLEYYFTAWNRPFKLSVELYNKWLDNLIPYKVDNVRIRYAGQNLAKGFARGVDIKLNGELLEDAESWVSISLLKTMEDILHDSYVDANGQTVYPGYYPRPTDQTLGFNLFFQDYLPGNPTFRVHLSANYGTGLPVGVNGIDRYDVTFRMKDYKRVDIGFTKILRDETSSNGISRKLKGFKGIWLGAEVFNLFNFNNTVSYLWIQTVGNQQGESDTFAVPNYLTSRRLNIRLQLKF